MGSRGSLLARLAPGGYILPGQTVSWGLSLWLMMAGGVVGRGLGDMGWGALGLGRALLLPPPSLPAHLGLCLYS